jgi:hypothetical protein
MELDCNGKRGSAYLSELDLFKLCVKYPKYTKDLTIFKEDDPYLIKAESTKSNNFGESMKERAKVFRKVWIAL